MRWAGFAALCFLYSGAAAWGEPMSVTQRDALRASGTVSEAVIAAIEASDRVRVIVSYHEPVAPSRAARDGATHRAAMAGRADAILSRLSRDEFQLHRRFVSLPALSGTLDLAGLERLAQDPEVQWIEPSLGGSGALAESIPLTKTDLVKGFGFSGQGVRVAVIDSGVDSSHQDLDGVVVEERCWCFDGGAGCCPDGNTTQIGTGAAADDNGHGTHVTGIIASNGSIAPPGAAPDVAVVAIKVLDEDNLFCCDGDVIAALDWINSQSTLQNPYVHIVSMSLATSLNPGFGVPCNPGIGSGLKSTAWTNAVTNLTNKGILVVVASGNDGIGGVAPAPACVQESFSVAASYDGDLGGPWMWSVCTDGSSGVDAWTCFNNAYDNAFAKTDLVAPGIWITSSWPGDLQLSIAGTSQATPQVTGCAALLIEANAGRPAWTLADLESNLRTSPDSVTSFGASAGSVFPRLDCVAALPEPSVTLQSLALFVALTAVARRFSPSRQAGRCASS